MSSPHQTMLAYTISTPGCTAGKITQKPVPYPSRPGDALIRVLRAGICNTDLEILKGYMGFTGILGHEFVGIVESIYDDDDDENHKHWIGKRVCGDINVCCSECQICNRNLDAKNSQMSRNHCPHRTVLGILKKDGTMAEYLTLPISNLHLVPDWVSDEEAAFAEPLAAACRIVEQGLIDFRNKDLVAILGDGKLGLMIAEVIGRESTTTIDEDEKKPVLFGKHWSKMNLVADSGVVCKHVLDCQGSDGSASADYAGKYDVVIDATGSPSGLTLAASLCRPMGTLVLKSTCAAGEKFNAAPFVIDELRVVGSRCGPIDKALELLAIKEGGELKPLNVKKYITKTFPLEEAEEAIKCAAEKDTMKVQIICSSS